MIEMLDRVSALAATALPLFDIPLMLHIIKRKSSKDLSMVWVIGIWLTSIAMAPAGIASPDLASKVFNIVNVVMLTLVVIIAYKYR